MARPARGAGAIPPRGRVLGIDLGDVRTGVSLTDPDQVIATAGEVLPSDGLDPEDLAAAIAALASEHEAVGVVVGLPRTLDGRDGPATRRARAVGRHLQAAGIAVELVDERFSTTEAERRMIEAGTRRRRRRERIDGVAATIIMQTWLEQRRARGGR